VRSPAFGIVVLTPVVLAGAVAASPGGPGVAVKADDASLTEPVVEQRSEGVSVVAMSKPPADLRFASTSMGPPPPAAVLGSGSFAAGASGLRIPAMALSAYRKAEQTMAAAAPGCGVSWNLLAGIGRIESSHANGGATDNRGTAVRPIYGPVLDGSLPGNEIIVQSNLGGRAIYARAMGPMQFLPGTWSRYASDGDGDGKSDPQNLFDASLSAARYLCSGGLNLRNQAQVMTSILRYNNSMAYAQNVLGWAAAYATGVAPLNLPAITGPVPALGDTHLESPGGLGPGMSGLPGGDPLAQLALGNSAEAGQLRLGHTPAVATGVAPEHGCEVICMASQLAPSQTPTSNLPPWLAPPPWMPQPLGAPMPGMMPLPGAPLPGPAPAGAPLPGPAPAGAPLPGMPPAPTAALPGMPPAPTAPLPGMPTAPLPGMPPAPTAPLPGMPPAPAAEVPFAPAPQTPPWLPPPPPPGAPVLGAPPGPPA
jgi:membrane-bound lytic murein transglycosylase B